MAEETVLLKFDADGKPLKKEAKKVEKYLDGVEDAAEDAGDEIDDAFDGKGGKLGGLKDALGGITSGLGPIGVAGAAAGAAAGLGSMIFGAIDSAAELSKLSEQTGLSVEFLSALENAAKLNGVELDELTEGFKTMTEIQADAALGSAGATEKLELLGLSIQDIENLGPEELMATFANAVGAIEDPTKRTAAAQIAFGGDAAAMLAVLDGGNTTFEEAIKKGEELGTTTEGEAAAAVEMKEKMAELQLRLSGLATDALPVLLDAFEFIADVISRVVEWVGKIIEKLVEFYQYIDGPIGTIIGTLVGFFQSVIDILDGPFTLAFNIIKTVIETIVSGIALYIQTYITIVKTAFKVAKTVITPIINAIRAVIEGAVGIVQTVFETFQGSLKTIINTIIGLWEGMAGGIVGVINSIIGAWNSLEFKVPEFSVFGKKFGGWTVGLPDLPKLPTPKIPRLAAGGIVTDPTLALVGEAGPEAVIPLSKLNNVAPPQEVKVVVELAFVDGADEMITAKVNRVNSRTSMDDSGTFSRIGEY